MSTRTRSKRGRPPRTPLTGKSLFAKKPKQTDSDSNSNSRCSTPQSSAASTPVPRASSRSSSRLSTRESARKSRSFISRVVESDDNVDSDEDMDENISRSRVFAPIEDTDVSDQESEVSFPADDSKSVSELSEASSTATPTAKSRFPSLLPRPVTPEYVDPILIPKLPLPSSSEELPIERTYLMQTIGIYEVLRHYRTILRLSPFRFEDFCVALSMDEQTCLLSEIHMSLLRALQREEDGNNTTFGPQDIKDSINISMLFLDALTWPELVRAYLDSDKSEDFQSGLPPLQNNDYYDLSIEKRIKLLQTLIDLFLSSNAVRDNILREGSIHYDENCRACHR